MSNAIIRPAKVRDIDGVDVTVTTYREDQPEGAAARAFYQRLGFVPERLTEKFGSPVQEFVLKH